jgi:protein Tex
VNAEHVAQIARELNVSVAHARAAADLLAEGATVPFIARYRKEATGSLDEVAVTKIRDRLAQLAALDDRRNAIVASLEERQLLTDELRHKLEAAETLASLEDVYQPYRPKRRTRASVARERGLEPLAELLLRQDPRINPVHEAARFITPEVPDADAALQGARDIIAERASDDANVRAGLRQLFWSRGRLQSAVRRGQETTGARFRDYFDWSEPIAAAPSHRVLAVFRGEAEDILSCSIEPPEDDAMAIVERAYVRGSSRSSEQVRLAVRDSYKRLLSRAMETETRAEAKRRADAAAIGVFAQNLRQLLLAPPLGQKRVLAIDPGVRTGCKTVVLDAQGQVLVDTVIYPDQRRREATDTVLQLLRQYQVEAIAVGNGTGGRETGAFLRSLDLSASIPVISVNEAGASVYSASEVARQEFPDRDITVRGAVSIGRRLMDPLAELVKIDPKSIGVGQYQHDVDQDDLRKSLDDVVISCVNAVGVEVNTASKQLLAYVSGLNPSVADNIVRYRSEHGPFRTRHELIRVPRLGAKAFEQSAGFLRIHGAANPLDASGVHPESYALVDRMAADLGVSVDDLVRDSVVRARINAARYVSESVGLPTLNDILAELARPGRDPRAGIEVVQFREGIHKLEDLEPGMVLPGVVTNVTAFGAFVDVGVHQDGLVHISQLADRFVRDPNEVVHVQQPVQVTVLEVDLNRRRIALSMRRNTAARASRPLVP